MSDEKMFEDYGIVAKTPIELIEDFVVQMMLQHQIHVSGINFAESTSLDKISNSMRPIEKVSTGPKGDNMSRMWSSVGKIELGVKEE